MAKARSYSLTLPLTSKNIRRNANKLLCHAARLQGELDKIIEEVKSLSWKGYIES